MGVAKFHSNGRPIRDQIGRVASGLGRRLAFAAVLVVFMGAAGPAHNEAVPSWAGFGGVAITETMSQKLQIPAVAGVIVTFVHPEGPAAKAGLRIKDMILQADGEPITDGKAWSEWIFAQVPGTRIELNVRRQDEDLGVSLTIEELPAGVSPDRR